MNEKRFILEISDVIEPEQEAAVIEAVKGHVAKTGEELSDYFKATDAIEIGGLLEAEVFDLREKLKAAGVTVRLGGAGVEAEGADEEPAVESVTCPRCGARLESLDWRCPDCFYEFPEYEYRDEGD
jgi:hypothetical protein